MSEYIIMTDSCCSLNRREVDELGITVLPLSFTMEGKTYLDTPDHADMSPETFFQKIADGVDCTTAAVNVGQFTDAMEKVLQEGKDILCVCFSSALSTTYQSACIAAEDLREKYPEAKILVIDSLSASRGQGMLLYRAVRERREKNLTIDELDAYVRSIIQSQCHWFIVDDLNHLKRGGRVDAATALVGTVLQIKPVMHMDDAGTLKNVTKARGRKASLTALVDRMEATAIDPAGQTVFISHGDCLEDAEFVAGEVRRRLGVETVHINYVGPVIGNHSGPGTIGIVFAKKV